MSNEEWNGTGLPPVGCECECNIDSGWDKCLVLADHPIGDSVAVMRCRDGELAWILASCARPLRTEEEKRRDDDRAELERIFENTQCLTLSGVIDKLIDAGFQREVQK